MADLGGEVIKIEAPPAGDYVRTMGPVAVGRPAGMSLIYTNSNRGKKSIVLDLKTAAGAATFPNWLGARGLSPRGFKPGTLDRWDLDYERHRSVNPSIVFCSLSGYGRSGPYRDLAAQGVPFDAHADFVLSVDHSEGSIRRAVGASRSAGMRASGLHAAMAVLAALHKAVTTGEGGVAEGAEAEVSAHWNWLSIQVSLNGPKVMMRGSYGGGEGIQESARYTYYRTGAPRSGHRCIRGVHAGREIDSSTPTVAAGEV